MIRTLRVAGLLALQSIIRGNIGVILLTVLILVLVALNLFFVPSLLQGLVSGADDKLVSTYSGDVVIESGEENPRIENAAQLVTKIETIEGVTAVSPRNRMSADITFGDERTTGNVYGVEPDREKAVFTIGQYLVEGTYLDSRDTDAIMLGMQLAGADRTDIELYSRSLRKVHAGDRVTVKYSNGVEKRYSVKGIFYAEFIQTDTQAFVSDREFRTVNPLAKDRATSIHVKVAPNADLRRIVEEVRTLRSGLKILTWQDTAGIIRSMTDSFSVINTILNIVNLLIAGITVFIVTYIDVVNRRRQIGVQRAIGITPASITLSYLLRAMFYAIIAIVLAALAFNHAVVPFEARYPFRFPFGDTYLLVSIPHMARISLLLLAVAVLAALVPVQRVIRTRILDAIWR